ncbi:MAG: hypothetical protein KAY24_11010 [Candidatus Eisenbacteria sp.]|nr:hypothetical protein [Candidatus Eisenbacteria bacterium]
MRRAGKTTYVYQLRRERMELGTGREQLSYLNFEDERLAGLTAAHLEDCFLVRMVWMESASERQRMVNPRRGARRGTGRCHGAADLRMAADSADLILEEGREEKRQGEGERPEPLLTGFAGDSQAQHGRRTSPG